MFQKKQMQGGFGDAEFDSTTANIFIPAKLRLRIQQMLAGNRHMVVEPLSLFRELQTSRLPQEQTAVQLILQQMNDAGDIGLAAF